MPYQTLQYHRKDHVGTITLNRPETGNAVNARLAQELADVCTEINQDADTRAVVITGAGSVFSAGVDPGTAGLSAATPVSRIACPVIAAINGDALGQGVELALACDMRIAVDTARLGMTHIASGHIPWDGGTQRLARLVGRARALQLLLLGDAITAQEALQMGLINRAVPSTGLAAAVSEIAQKVASGAPLAVKYAKEAVDKGLDLTLEQGMRLETDLYLLLQTTRDRIEGITAFQEKRPPDFKGN